MSSYINFLTFLVITFCTYTYNVCLLIGAESHLIHKKSVSSFNTTPSAEKNSSDFKGSKSKKNPIEHFKKWQDLLNSHDAFFEDYTSFITQHPDWPSLNELQKKAEEALSYHDSESVKYTPEESPDNEESNTEHLKKIVSFFKKYPAITGHGQFIYARSLLSLKQVALAKKEFNKLITLYIVPAVIIPHLPQYKKYLPFLWASLQANHLLLSKKISQAQLLIPYMDSSDQIRFMTRMAILRKETNAIEKAYELLSQSGNNHGLAFELLRYHTSFDTPEHNQRALNLLTEHIFMDERLHPVIYWELRHKLARRLISESRYKDAYQVVKQHGFYIPKQTHQQQKLCSEECSTAILTTAWLGIMHAEDAITSLTSLKELSQHVRSPITKAKVWFWIAKAHASLGQLPLSFKALGEASQYRSTFYGQIAMSMLQRPEFEKLQLLLGTTYEIPQDNLFPEPSVSNMQKKSFDSLELVKVIKQAPEIRKNITYTHLFFNALLETNSSLAFHSLVFKLAEEIKGKAFAVLLSKRKHMTFKFVYPLLDRSLRKATINKISPKTPYVEFLPALVHALIRRESAFDEMALSEKNAKGMMQLLQSTATLEAPILKEKYGISISKPINLFDKKTNILYGTSHFASLLEEFDGNLILAIASYNAGPMPVKRWIETFGNPKDPAVDIINWIESIPYKETRNYVQRVLENLTVYEQLLSEENKTDIDLDLLGRIK